MTTPRTFFIAGTMQGSRSGDARTDQFYRQQIEDIILGVFPKAIIHCPDRKMKHELASQEQEIRQQHRKLADMNAIDSDSLSVPLQTLVQTFHHLTDLAGQCDVCIAYLPDHEASMGTAMEMYSAWRNRREIITVTDMVQNLAVLSCSTHIIRSLDDLGPLLARRHSIH